MKTRLEDLIYPLFVKEGSGIREEVPSMPGVYRFSVDTLLEEAAEAAAKGIRKVLLFGVPGEKDAKGASAYASGNIASKAVSALKRSIPDIVVFTDVCLCAYTTHGHCGILGEDDRTVDLSLTLKALSDMALSHAAAGADFVAPSAMAQGQVATIRKVLDKNGYGHTKIMGYSAKFASAAYGPFRDIADSAPSFGDRRAYQLDPKDAPGALKEIAQDIKEGADIVMVKPALWYLDIVRQAKEETDRPLAVYNVSGEYAMVKNGARSGAWDEKRMVEEILGSMKRAGADLIITYHAKDIAGWSA